MTKNIPLLIRVRVTAIHVFEEADIVPHLIVASTDEMNTFRENILKVKRSLDLHFGVPNPQSRYS